MPAPRPKKPKNKVDLEWLRARVLAHPDARLKDHAEAFAKERGVSVSLAAVYYAMVALGFTHKKRSTPKSETRNVSARSAKPSSDSSRR